MIIQLLKMRTLLILVSLTLIGFQATSQEIRLNSGGTLATYNGETYDDDQYFTSSYPSGGSAALSEPFNTERISNGSHVFNYNIPVTNGNYDINLLFAENYFGDPSKGGGGVGSRVFDVFIEGTKVLEDFDIFAEVGHGVPATKSFTVDITDGQLNIQFSALREEGGADRAKVNGIEIVPASGTISVSSVTLTPVTTSIGVGNSQQLTANVQPSNASDSSVNWISSDSSIATVSSSGIVTGVSEGTVTIQATSVSNNTISGQASISVTTNSVSSNWINGTSNSLYYTDGFVGIGTANPKEQFQIGDAFTFHDHVDDVLAFRASYDDFGSSNWNYLEPNKSAFSISGTEDILFRIASGDGKNVGDPISWTTALTIDENSGNIGIGNVALTDYKLGVDGKLRAREVRVDIDQWADYVFHNNYLLPTLDEVKTHIKEKGHLINVPSAEEIEANGIELGEMNKLLLEKIEELTLYILQQDDKIEKLTSVVEKLKAK